MAIFGIDVKAFLGWRCECCVFAGNSKKTKSWKIKDHRCVSAESVHRVDVQVPTNQLGWFEYHWIPVFWGIYIYIYHVMSCHVISYHIISYQWNIAVSQTNIRKGVEPNTQTNWFDELSITNISACIYVPKQTPLLWYSCESFQRQDPPEKSLSGLKSWALMVWVWAMDRPTRTACLREFAEMKLLLNPKHFGEETPHLRGNM